MLECILCAFGVFCPGFASQIPCNFCALAHKNSTETSSRSGPATITLTSKQLEEMLEGARKEGDKIRTPEARPKTAFDKKDIFGSALIFTPPVSHDEASKGIPSETQTIIETLRAKVKEAAEVRPLTIGNGKIEMAQHSVIEKMAKECATTHFKSPESLKALKSMVQNEKVQTNAQYPHTILSAVFKCCTSRGVHFSQDDIGLATPEAV